MRIVILHMLTHASQRLWSQVQSLQVLCVLSNVGNILQTVHSLTICVLCVAGLEAEEWAD